MSLPSALLRAALAGAATGCRSQSAITAVALSGPPAPNRVDRWLTGRSARRSLVVGALSEVVADKSAQAPPRTLAPALATRVALGGLSAWVLARRHAEHGGLAAVTGVLASAATSFGGVRARAAVAARTGGDLPGALAEDALTLGLAAGAVRLP